MEQISKELIKNGINNNTITFGMEYDMLVSYIGDYWFFISSEHNKTKDDFSIDELVDMVYNAINDEPINNENEELATECLYYKTILLEHC